MGGLRKKMPITFITFLLSTLAIAGIPFFSGFFSKDEILWWAFASSRGHWALWLVGAIAAALTAFYMFRLVFMTFFGEQKTDARAKDHIPESPFVITLPLMILAFLATFGGFLGVPHVLGNLIGHFPNKLEHFLAPVFEHTQELHHIAAHGAASTEYSFMAISVAIAVLGISVAWVMYCKNPQLPGKIVAKLPKLHRAIFNKWYIDEFYDALIVNPTKRFGTFLWQIFDVRLVDGLVNGVAWVVRGSGRALRHTQTGFTHNYAMSMVLGVVVILAIYVFN